MKSFFNLVFIILLITVFSCKVKDSSQLLSDNKENIKNCDNFSFDKTRTEQSTQSDKISWQWIMCNSGKEKRIMVTIGEYNSPIYSLNGGNGEQDLNLIAKIACGCID